MRLTAHDEVDIVRVLVELLQIFNDSRVSRKLISSISNSDNNFWILSVVLVKILVECRQPLLSFMHNT